MGKIKKIFITHTHGKRRYVSFQDVQLMLNIGDHIFGILPLLAGRLNGAGGTVDDVDDPRMASATDKEVS